MGAVLTRLFCSSVKVNNQRYYEVKKIGEGGYSFVYLVKDEQGALFALKKISIELQEHQEFVRDEILSHLSLKGRRGVLQLVSYEIKPLIPGRSQGLLVFPFYSRGTVQEFVDRCPSVGLPVTEKLILRWSVSLCHAVAAFHGHNPPLAHRDIKPQNLLLTDDLQDVVLMDLGSVSSALKQIRSTREALQLEEKCSVLCSAPYKAPELFAVSAWCDITEKTDIWSLGCTIYAMAFGQSPCDGSATSACCGSVRFPSLHSYSEEFVDFIRWILAIKPEHRPSVGQIIDHIHTMASFSDEIIAENLT